MNNFRLLRITAALASIAVVAAIGNFASGESTRIVSPSSTKNVEGDQSIRPDRAPNKLQFLFPASDFADLPPSQRWLVAFNSRGDQTQTQAVDWVYPDTEIWISTTSKTSDTLSIVFAENHGTDKTLVHDGALTQRILATGTPRDFTDGMRFQTPFYYDPSLGNLLIERIDRGGSSPSPAIDVQSTSGFPILAGNFKVDAVNGTRFSGLPVTQFEFVPEPAALVLSCLAAMSVMARRRKCGHHGKLRPA